MPDNITPRKTKTAQGPDTRWLKDRDGTWYAKFTVDGREFVKTTNVLVGKAGALSAARKLVHRWRAYVLEHGAFPTPQWRQGVASGCTLEKALDEWVSRRKSSMQIQYQRAAGHLLVTMGADKDAAQVMQRDVDDHILRRSKTVTPQTYGLELRILHKALCYAKKHDLVANAPRFELEPIKPGPRGKTAGKLHCPEKMKAFIERLSPRLRRAVIFAQETGCRLHEIMRLDPAQVKPMDDSYFVAQFYLRPDQTKCAANARWVRLNPLALEQAQWAMDAGTAELFPMGSAPSAAINRLNKRMGHTPGDYITFRDMRHAMATGAALGTGGTAVGMALLGHVTHSAHAHYLHRSSVRELEQVREFYRARDAARPK